MEVEVKGSCLALAIVLLFWAAPAVAKYADAIQACTRDMRRLCATGQPGGGGLNECVKAHFKDFAASCQTALVRVAAEREACRADIAQQCAAIAPGSGRVFLCARRHYAALSEPCKEAIGHAAERQAGAR